MAEKVAMCDGCPYPNDGQGHAAGCLRDAVDRWEERARRAESTLSRLTEWTHAFGKELKPRGADTYGEGVRDSKVRVARILETYPQAGLIVGTITFDFVFVRVAEAQALAKIANAARRYMRSEEPEDHDALADALCALDATESK